MRLQPRPGGDVLDRALAGRTAVIETIEEDDQGVLHVAVVLEDDPGRDLAAAHPLAHRFFFAPAELEPLEEPAQAPAGRRVLVAGIGNVFCGDDGFGVAVAQRLAATELPAGLEVVDFGIRGLDLAYALGQPYDAVVLVDALAGGECPGRLRIIEPDTRTEDAPPFDSHRMNPAAVLGLARRLGGLPPQVLLIGCAPGQTARGESLSMNLSAPVAAAVEPAVRVVRELAELLLAGGRPGADGRTQNNGSGNLPQNEQIL